MFIHSFNRMGNYWGQLEEKEEGAPKLSSPDPLIAFMHTFERVEKLQMTLFRGLEMKIFLQLASYLVGNNWTGLERSDLPIW